LTRWTMGKAGGVVAPEPTIMAKMKQYIGTAYPYERVNNAIYISAEQKNISSGDEERLRELGLNSGRYFLFLGRIVPEKGVFELVEAIGRERELFRDQKFKMFFSGEGSAVEALKSIIQREGLDAHFAFNTKIIPEDKWILLRHCRSMVLPSWEENLPISILEAFGVEAPVIGSDIKEIENLILDSHVGKTFIKKDSTSLAKVLRENILSSKAKSPESFQAAMAPYDLRQMGTDLTSLYEKVARK
jgi:glycosyltransferase involved in cell wall biosynthesis